MRKPNYSIERGLIGGGIAPVAGVDEVGRGPLAGPVVVAAVILNPEDLPRGVDDSKALSAIERERLFEIILKKAACVSLACASVAEIDTLNIRGATLAAMARAVNALALRPAFALIDGRDEPPGLGCSARAVIGGDALCISIAAASIVAKVARDRLMRRLHRRCPDYGFDEHVGYGTPRHLEAIERHGVSPFHRLSFKPCTRRNERAAGPDAVFLKPFEIVEIS
jgi:ribonuclease HII